MLSAVIMAPARRFRRLRWAKARSQHSWLKTRHRGGILFFFFVEDSFYPSEMSRYLFRSLRGKIRKRRAQTSRDAKTQLDRNSIVIHRNSNKCFKADPKSGFKTDIGITFELRASYTRMIIELHSNYNRITGAPKTHF